MDKSNDTPKTKPDHEPDRSTWVYNTPEEQRLRHPEELDFTAVAETQKYEPAVLHRTDYSKTVYKLTELPRKVSVNLADLKPLCSLTGDEPIAKRIAIEDRSEENQKVGLNWYEAEMIKIGTCKPAKNRQVVKRELSRRCLTFYEYSTAEADSDF